MKKEVGPEAGWIPKAGNAPWVAVIPKRPVTEASWVRRKAMINGRKLRRAFSDHRLPCMECKAALHPQADEATQPALCGLAQ